MSPSSSPFALGWARSLALANAPPNATVRELFDRQLLIGLIGASVAFSVFPTIPSVIHQIWADVLSTGVFILAQIALMLVFVVRGQRVTPYAHAFLAMGYAVPLVGLLLLPRDMVWLGLAWALPYPVLAALLTGFRGGVLWTSIVVVTFGVAYLGPWLGLPLDGGFDASLVFGPEYLLISYAALALFQMLAVGWFIQQRGIVETMLAEEHRRTDQILRNVLPGDIPDRLQRGEVIADALDEVSVVFADLVGFTTIAEGIPARRVVAMIGELFGEIDRIAEECGVEKLKTIGDCYMAVVGAPHRVEDHADRALRFAQRVQAAMSGRACFGRPLQLRIGVHSGPAMAGVLGEKRLLYDLWGDTVNVASRLESSGVPGEIQVSEATLRLCTHPWHAEDRGLVQLKGRSGMRCFLLRDGPPVGEVVKRA